jgi:hypothetical protein
MQAAEAQARAEVAVNQSVPGNGECEPPGGAPAWTDMTCVRNSQRGSRFEAGMGPAANVLAPFSPAQHSPSSGQSRCTRCFPKERQGIPVSA